MSLGSYDPATQREIVAALTGRDPDVRQAAIRMLQRGAVDAATARVREKASRISEPAERKEGAAHADR